MLYAQSEDRDDDSGVLLTDTYTEHCLSSHIWYTAALFYPTTINCLVLPVYIAHSRCRPHTRQSSSGTDRGQLSDDITTKHKQSIGKLVLS